MEICHAQNVDRVLISRKNTFLSLVHLFLTIFHGPKTWQNKMFANLLWWATETAGMGQIWVGAAGKMQVDKDSTGGWSLNETKRAVKGSTGGQGLDAWSINFLKIQNIKIRFSGSANIRLPWLDKFISKPIPTYCQTINIVSKLRFVLLLLLSGPYLTHISEILIFAFFPGPDLTHILSWLGRQPLGWRNIKLTAFNRT